MVVSDWKKPMKNETVKSYLQVWAVGLPLYLVTTFIVGLNQTMILILPFLLVLSILPFLLIRALYPDIWRATYKQFPDVSRNARPLISKGLDDAGIEYSENQVDEGWQGRFYKWLFSIDSYGVDIYLDKERGNTVYIGPVLNNNLVQITKTKGIVDEALG